MELDTYVYPLCGGDGPVECKAYKKYAEGLKWSNDLQKYFPKSRFVKSKGDLSSSIIRRISRDYGYTISDNSGFRVVRIYSLEDKKLLRQICFPFSTPKDDIVAYMNGRNVRYIKRSKPYGWIVGYTLLSKDEWKKHYKPNSGFESNVGSFSRDKSLSSIFAILKDVDKRDVWSGTNTAARELANKVVRGKRHRISNSRFPCVEVYGVWPTVCPDTGVVHKTPLLALPSYTGVNFFDSREDVQLCQL